MVAKNHSHHLEAAISAAAKAFGDLAAREAYDYIKRHLAAKGVPHDERTMHPHEVPSHASYWHA
jgi:alcohol dehydrogenase class IV